MSTAGRCIARSTSSGTVVGPGIARNSRPARTLISVFPFAKRAHPTRWSRVPPPATIAIMITRRFLMAATSALAAPCIARADTFPNGPIRILVPFGPGSATDQSARAVGDGLNRLFGVPVVVENKPGANGAIAADLAAKSKPDGQTIFVCSNTAAASNVALMKSLPYDPLRDFDPVTIIGKAPVFLMVNPKVEAKTAAEFVALAKRMPGKINFGSGSSSTRISGELLKAKAGIDMVHVPYKSTPLALQDTMSGHVQMCFADPVTSLPQVKAGTVRCL